MVDSKALEMLENPEEERDELQRLVRAHGVIGGARKYWNEKTEGNSRTLSGLAISIGSIVAIRWALETHAGFSTLVATAIALIIGVVIIRRWI